MAAPLADLPALLAQAWRTRTPIADLPPALVPADAPAAYAVQQAVLADAGAPAVAWKVGAKTADGPVQGAVLSARTVQATPGVLELAGYARPGLELEIAFRLGRDFAPRDAAWTRAEVLAGIDATCATIELVASRYARWPDVPPLAQLADSQNHGALVVGEPVPFDPALATSGVSARLRLDGADLFTAPAGGAANPAGDPLRLLPWLVEHVTRGGAVLPAGTIVTAGSYVGLIPATGPGEVVGEIAGLPAVRVRLR